MAGDTCRYDKKLYNGSYGGGFISLVSEIINFVQLNASGLHSDTIDDHLFCGGSGSGGYIEL